MVGQGSARVDDQKVFNSIFNNLRSGAHVIGRDKNIPGNSLHPENPR
jgi:transposase